MNEVVFNVPNISCMHCVHTIQTELAEVKGVKKVEASAATKTVKIDFDSPATPEQLASVLREINYPPA